jgi:hypothetical protein
MSIKQRFSVLAEYSYHLIKLPDNRNFRFDLTASNIKQSEAVVGIVPWNKT